ncbi:MAG: class I SAM-dependent methyltransferase [Bacteroidia bacterium]|nr:class I SAM-dependent methyltransferase [Bacteroidia bacterium]
MENLTECLVCGNNKFALELTCKDYVASGETFNLLRCTNCSFLFTNPRPTEAEISKYYQSNRYISHAGDKQNLSFIYKIYDWVRDYSIGKKIRLIKKYHTSGNLMDLGCGLGYFLNGVILDKTFNAIGVDVSEDAIKFVQSKFGHAVKNENELDSIQPASMNVITQWHVLEHVHNLSNRMKQLKKILHADGTMFIAVPNSDSWDAKHYKEFWDAYDVPRHLYHFNTKSFNLLMNKYGFKVVAIKSMPFDAPYISMRSELNKGNSMEFLRGAVSGFQSSISAFKNNEHSSLMFIVKHV